MSGSQIISELKSFPVDSREISISNSKHARIDPSIAEYSDLERLKVRHSRLNSLPRQIQHLRGLRSLILPSNRFSIFPNHILELKNLQVLNMKRNRLQCLPENIGQLDALTKLYMSQNAFKELPTNICHLYSLREISMKCNKLHRLPDDFGNLKSLRTIDLSHNKLKTLPNSIGDLRNLTRVNFSYNAIEHLPDSIGGLDRLKTMDLSQNILMDVPDSFSYLCNLSVLDLSRNALSSLPTSFGNLSSLAWLCLDSNRLTELPCGFGKLGKLRCLYLDNNQLRELPESFGNLANVEIVSISFNFELASLPQTFGNLCSLEDLFLNYCRLSELPVSFPRLSRLRNLGLNGNELKFLNANFGDLKRLKALYLNTNTHLQLPLTLSKLKKLERLYLNGIMMKDIPNGICDLKSLKYLNLNHNEISRLPENIGNLSNLIELGVSSCQLSSIPSGIGELAGLRELSLFGNALKSLPSSVMNIRNTLISLDLGKNNLDDFGKGSSLGYSELVQMFGSKLIHARSTRFCYLSFITTEELHLKLYKDKPHLNIKVLKSLGIRPVPSNNLSEDAITDILNSILAPYIKSSGNLAHLRRYIKHLYNSSIHSGDWSISPFYVNPIKNLVESIFLLLLKRNPIDFIDHIVVRVCEASKNRQDKQIAKLRLIFYYLSACPEVDLERFIYLFVTQEKENVFNYVASYYNTVESMEVIDYWKYQVGGELGFDCDFKCTSLRTDVQDPFKGYPGNFLNAFYSKFTPEYVVNELAREINSNSLILCDALNKLKHESVPEDLKTEMYTSEKGLLYATKITPKYVEHVLLEMGIISNGTHKDQNLTKRAVQIFTVSTVAVIFLICILLNTR